MKFSLTVKRVNAVLILYFGTKFVNLFFYHFAQHAALHREARLLVDHLCNDVSHSRKISGALLDCQAARSLLASGTIATSYAVEHALKELIVNTWRGATHELVMLARLMGFFTMCVFTTAYVSSAAWDRWVEARAHRHKYQESWTQAFGRAPLPLAGAHASKESAMRAYFNQQRAKALKWGETPELVDDEDEVDCALRPQMPRIGASKFD